MACTCREEGIADITQGLQWEHGLAAAYATRGYAYARITGK